MVFTFYHFLQPDCHKPGLKEVWQAQLVKHWLTTAVSRVDPQCRPLGWSGWADYMYIFHQEQSRTVCTVWVTLPVQPVRTHTQILSEKKENKHKPTKPRIGYT